jgi:hypothetical protein
MADSEEVNVTIEYLTVEMICRKNDVFKIGFDCTFST